MQQAVFVCQPMSIYSSVHHPPPLAVATSQWNKWGRGQETYGEDPFLTAEMGAQYVLGIQNWDPSNASTAYVEAGATCKVSE